MTPSQNAKSEQLVVFNSGEMLCAIELSYVQEINKDIEITPVHLVPPDIAGVINLRGQIVTVMHLGVKLGILDPSARVKTAHDRIIILRWQDEMIGLHVGAVSDIVTPAEGDIMPVPQNIPQNIRDYIKAVCQTEDSLISVLDVDAVLGKRAGS